MEKGLLPAILELTLFSVFLLACVDDKSVAAYAARLTASEKFLYEQIRVKFDIAAATAAKADALPVREVPAVSVWKGWVGGRVENLVGGFAGVTFFPFEPTSRKAIGDAPGIDCSGSSARVTSWL